MFAANGSHPDGPSGAENNLLCRVIEPLLRQPVQMHLGPMLASTVDPPVRSRNDSSCWRLRRRSSDAAVRARTRSRTASCIASGTQTGVRSPARNSRASVTASRPAIWRSTAVRSGRRGRSCRLPLGIKGIRCRTNGGNSPRTLSRAYNHANAFSVSVRDRAADVIGSSPDSPLEGG